LSENEKKGFIEKWKEKRAKNNKKKLIEEIRKKDKKINKDKEEIKKMAMELKDGKLVKKAERVRGAPVQQAPPVQQAQVIPPVAAIPQAEVPPELPSMPQAPVIPPVQEPQANNPFNNVAQPEIPPQEFAKQPTGPAQELSQEDAMKDVPINFVMLGGLNFQFGVKLGTLKQVLTYIAEAINNQEVIELGNRLINPRHIVYYEY